LAALRVAAFFGERIFTRLEYPPQGEANLLRRGEPAGDEDGVVGRIGATPLRSGDRSQLAEEVLEGLRLKAEPTAAR
jgi:hypothetical protein